MKRNLTHIKWAHAVNSQSELNAALSDELIDMLEADIVLGKLTDQESEVDIPIMGHPPAKTSDISLAMFLLQIINYHKHSTAKVKGIKLDFKSIEVFEMAMPSLQELISTISFPIWLNADIIAGPIDPPNGTAVNATRFLSKCVDIKQAVLSVGWTTCWGPLHRDGHYTSENIAHMLAAIKANNITTTGHTLTFPVRAGIAANSQTQLLELLNSLSETNDCTLTIWSSPNDYVQIEHLRNLILTIGTDRIYLDVPEKLEKELKLLEFVSA